MLLHCEYEACMKNNPLRRYPVGDAPLINVNQTIHGCIFGIKRTNADLHVEVQGDSMVL